MDGSRYLVRGLTDSPSEDSSEAESRDEFRDRWLFNLGVFFLLVPFTILVGYTIGSFIGVGFGVALVAWRVAVTPEITSHISPKVHGRYRPFLRDLFLGLVVGFTLLGVSDLATQMTGWNARAGSPLSYSQPGTECGPGGCLMIYNPLYIVLDYLFWVGVAFVLISIFRIASIRFVHYSNNDKRPFVPASRWVYFSAASRSCSSSKFILVLCCAISGRGACQVSFDGKG